MLKPHPHFITGITLIKEGAYHEALTQFKTALHENTHILPDILIALYKQLILNDQNNAIRILIAELYFYFRQFDEAIDELEELIERNPKTSAGFILLQKIYNQQEKRERIKHIFEYAFSKKNYEPMILEFLQYIYFQEQDIQNSIRFYQKLIETDSQNVIYYKNLLEMYLKNKQYQEAVSICETILKISPYDKPYIAQKIEEILQHIPENLSLRTALILIYLQQYQPHHALEHIEKLKNLFPQKKEEITALYKEALQLFPNMLEILLPYSQFLIQLNEYSQSASYLRTAFEQAKHAADQLIPILNLILSKCPKQVLALHLLADIYYEKSDFQKSLSYMEVLIEIDQPELELLEEKITRCLKEDAVNDYGQLILAKIDMAKLNFAQAHLKLEGLLNRDYDFAARILKSKIFEVEGNESRALDMLRETLTLYPFSADVHVQLKKINESIIQNEIMTCLEEIANQKNSAQKDKTICELALLYLRLGDMNEALNYFQKIVANPKLTDSIQILIGRCFMETSRYDLAINHLKRVLEKVQQSNIKLANKIRYLLSMNYILLGKIEQATDCLDNIMEFDINFPNISEIVTHYKQHTFIDIKGKSVSGCLNFSKNKELSICTVLEQDVSKINPLKADYISISFSYAHNNKGVDNLLKENYKAAKDEFLLAIQMDPQLDVAHCNLAFIYILEKEYNSAWSYLKQAEGLNPKYEVIFLGMGILHLLNKDYASALTQFKKALQLNPKNDLVFINMGDTYYAQGDVQQAFTYWRKGAASQNLFFLMNRRICYLKQGNLSIQEWIGDFQYPIETLLVR